MCQVLIQSEYLNQGSGANFLMLFSRPLEDQEGLKSWGTALSMGVSAGMSFWGIKKWSAYPSHPRITFQKPSFSPSLPPPLFSPSSVLSFDLDPDFASPGIDSRELRLLCGLHNMWHWVEGNAHLLMNERMNECPICMKGNDPFAGDVLGWPGSVLVR